MKKICAFPGVILILFFVFACTLPSEIEVTGSPSIKFAANMDFGHYFSGMMDNSVNSDSHTKTIPGTNPTLEYRVFILRMEIFRKENYKCEVDESSFVGDQGNILINGVEIPVDRVETDKKFVVLEDEAVIASSDDPHTTSFKGLEDYLEGFEFVGIQSKIYISGTKLADSVSIDLHRVIPGQPDEILVKEGDITEKIPSGLESVEEYPGLELPPGGTNIDIADIINTGGDLHIKYKIYLPKHSEIEYDLFDETHTIVAEIVIWLPMTFESIVEDAKFKFPDFFNGITDVLKSLSGTGCIEDMGIKIAIDPLNPFGHGIFIMSDAAYGDINSTLDEHNFFINLTKEELDYINDNPFDPSFTVTYPEIHSLLEIPKGDIMITTVTLDAKLNYNAEF